MNIEEFGLTFISGDIDNGVSKHTYDDYGLIMTSHNIPKPDAQRQVVNVPYKSGSIDLTDIAGDTPYKDREGLSFSFTFKDGGREHVETRVSDISKFIHGKKLIMISDADPLFFYIVRLQVKFNKTAPAWCNLTMEGTSEPFKYARYKAGENWIWDTFSFVDGIITKLEDIVVENGKSVVLANDSIYTVPEFVVEESDGLGIVFNGRTYSMPSVDSYYFPQIRIGNETMTLEFVGSGTVSVIFRGRYI